MKRIDYLTLLACFVLAGVLGAASCEDVLPNVGEAVASIARVPADVRCVVVTVAGASSTVSHYADVVPDKSATIAMSGLPLGEVTFSGSAHDAACAVVNPGTASTWVAEPINVLIESGIRAQVKLRFRRPAGEADVEIDFDSETGQGEEDSWEDAVAYHIVVDRFADGDVTRNRPVGGVEPAANFQGGDLLGVLNGIEEGYFNDLGVNTLILSSVVDSSDASLVGPDGHASAGYLGQWPQDPSAVDSRYGDLETLRAVVNEAHARGIRVLLDYQANHVAIDSPIYAAHPDWFTSLTKDGMTCVCGQDCSWDGPDAERCWLHASLPRIDQANDEARAWSVDNARSWLSTSGADGLRLTGARLLPLSFLSELRSSIDRNVLLVGDEVTGDLTKIVSRVDPDTTLDGQWDYPSRSALVETLLLRTASFADLDTRLAAHAASYPENATMALALGTVDTPRAIHFAQDTALWTNPWDPGSDHAWTNPPSAPTTASAYERLALAYAVLFTTPGMPTLLYGDELGQAGGGIPDNHRFMPKNGLFSAQLALRNTVSKLAAARAVHPALRRGQRTTLEASTNVWLYEMRDGDDVVFVVLNRADTAVTTTTLPAGTYRDALTDTVVSAPLLIPARGVLVLTAQ